MGDAIFLPALVRGLPPPPDATFDPYLDAAAACFARHGISRTAVADIAKQMGVSRTTVYRQVGSIDNVVRLLAARELHRFQETVPAAIGGAKGPHGVLRIMAGVIRFAWQNPVLSKVLHDEPDILGQFFAADLPALVDDIATIVVPVVEAAISAGLIRAQDPRALAEWVTRIGGALVLAPPTTDLDTLLEAMLLPVLEPR
jgi:AcrR family transcriptional regulator